MKLKYALPRAAATLPVFGTYLRNKRIKAVPSHNPNHTVDPTYFCCFNLPAISREEKKKRKEIRLVVLSEKTEKKKTTRLCQR